jgi:hypothetical protein
MTTGWPHAHTASVIAKNCAVLHHNRGECTCDDAGIVGCEIRSLVEDRIALAIDRDATTGNRDRIGRCSVHDYRPSKAIHTWLADRYRKSGQLRT